MEFFKKRVRQYQEKKLNEILSKIQFHQYMKKELEQKIKEIDNVENTRIIREIAYHNKLIKIWENNKEKLERQMSEMDD
jgi:tRNA U34 5-carboxymethylaminomethyl modifying enzyme MnmG/GidA